MDDPIGIGESVVAVYDSYGSEQGNLHPSVYPTWWKGKVVDARDDSLLVESGSGERMWFGRDACMRPATTKSFFEAERDRILRDRARR